MCIRYIFPRCPFCIYIYIVLIARYWWYHIHVCQLPYQNIWYLSKNIVRFLRITHYACHGLYVAWIVSKLVNMNMKFLSISMSSTYKTWTINAFHWVLHNISHGWNHCRITAPIKSLRHTRMGSSELHHIMYLINDIFAELALGGRVGLEIINNTYEDHVG